MVSKTDKIAVLAVVLIAAVFVGEYLTYGYEVDRDASASWESDKVSYSVKSSGSDEYRAVLFDNAGQVPVSKLYIYVDGTYDKYYRDACDLSDGARPCYIEAGYYAEQVRESLKIRGFTDVTLIDGIELEEILRSTMSSSAGIGIMVLSYAVPGSVYSGQSDCLLVNWVNGGGGLYWLSSEIGRFYTDDDGLHKVSGDCTAYFFGTSVPVDCDDKDELGYITGNPVGGVFTEALCLKNSTTEFGIDITGLSGIQLGFGEGGYASISLVSVGSGMICVFAGGFDINQLDDVGQVIASKLTCDSVFISMQKDKVTRETVRGSFGLSTSDAYLFIYTGGTYTNFGACFHA